MIFDSLPLLCSNDEAHCKKTTVSITAINMALIGERNHEEFNDSGSLIHRFHLMIPVPFSCNANALLYI